MARGEKNGLWKGDNASYAAKHIWARNNFGRPQICEHCGITEKRMYHWANISGEYIRDRTDWLRLCVPCHKRHDIKVLGGKIKARPLKVQPSKICPECNVEFFKNPHFSRTQWNEKVRCSQACSAKEIGRLRLGSTQSDETKALKSQRLRERWATNDTWREHVTKKMIGNLYAYKEVTKQPRRRALQERIDMKKNPLGRLDHGTSPVSKAPNVKSGAKGLVSGMKYVAKPLNAHRAQPGFKGKVA